MKKSLLALLAFGALSTVAMPVYADSAKVQNSSTSSITTGSRNRSSQMTNQRAIGVLVNPSDSTGSSQSSSSHNDTYGDYNNTHQRTNQDVTDYSVNYLSRRGAASKQH